MKRKAPYSNAINSALQYLSRSRPTSSRYTQILELYALSMMVDNNDGIRTLDPTDTDVRSQQTGDGLREATKGVILTSLLTLNVIGTDPKTGEEYYSFPLDPNPPDVDPDDEGTSSSWRVRYEKRN